LASESCLGTVGASLNPETGVTRKRRNEPDGPWSTVQRRGRDAAAAALAARIVGQAMATGAVAAGLTNAVIDIGFDDHTAATRRPRATFFFAGPTGVGKTETAKTLTKYIFGREADLVRYDMSEYQSSESLTRLVGSPPGYVGYQEGGQLTEAVRQRPASVLLFDEVEKAHARVLDLFLHIIDDGRATDGRGFTIDFSKTLVIFTSNLGSAQLITNGGFPRYDALRESVRGEIERVLVRELRRPELYGRLEPCLVIFDLIRPAVVPELCRVLLSRLAENAHEQLGVGLRFEVDGIAELVAAELARGSYRYGGRAARSVLETRVLAPLKTWILDHGRPYPDELLVAADGATVEVVACADGRTPTA
jgi:ATP-dependent Clp protease ATP-binding subunit ClpA